MPEKIQKAIDDSDAFIVLLTKQASTSPSVNQEIGFAKKAGRKIIPMVEEGVDVGVLLQGYEVLRFNLENVQEAIKKVTDYIAKVFPKKEDDTLIKITCGVLVVMLGIIFLYALTGQKK